MAEEKALLLRHYELVCRRFGAAKGTVLMRRFAACYAQGRPGASKFRGEVSKIASPAEFRQCVERHFPQA